MTNEYTSLEKYSSHTLFEMVWKGCERWVGDWTDCNILNPNSFVFSSSSFSGLLNQGSWGPTPLLGTCSHCLELQQTDSKCNLFQISQLSVTPGYIIVWHPPASYGRRIPNSTRPHVKVIPWYLRPDATVIYTSASLIWQLSRGSICNNTKDSKNSSWYIRA